MSSDTLSYRYTSSPGEIKEDTASYLEHGAEVIVAEEYTQFKLFKVFNQAKQPTIQSTIVTLCGLILSLLQNTKKSSILFAFMVKGNKYSTTHRQ